MEPRPDHRLDPWGKDKEHFDRVVSQADDLDFDKIDFNDPAHIAQIMGMRAPPTMSPEQLRSKSKALSKSIFANRDKLGAILDRHEATIQKRWAKKKKQQKIEVLESAWPNMAKSHRPDFVVWRQKSSNGGTGHQDEAYRKHFMCPYINQEDLLKPKTLPLLLNSRGRHLPGDFAGADFESMHFGTVTNTLQPIFLNTYTMMLHGARTAEEYGRVVAWDDDDEAFELMTTRKQFMPGEGYIVLETQKMIMDFLVACCKMILHDIPEDTLLTDEFPVEPEPVLKTEKDVDGYETMATMALEAPYRVPSRLDFERVEALLAARVDAAESHIWALREDPGYFMEELQDIMEHRQETMKDVNGDPHPSRKTAAQNVFQARVVGDLITSTYVEFEVYYELHKQAQNLRKLYSKHEAAISPKKDLPEEFLMALLRFRHFLNQGAKGAIGTLKHGVVASPPMRRFFVREPPRDPTSSIIQIRSKPGVKKEKGEEEIIWLLRTLWEDGHTLFLTGMPFVLDELERIMQADPKAKDLVSARIAAQIGVLSIISQCLRQLELYQPWARNFDDKLIDREPALKKEFSRASLPWAKVLSAMNEKNKKLDQMTKFITSPDKFTYPSTKRRTRETTEAMIRAEWNLDVFWVSVDQLLHSDANGLQGMAVKDVLSQKRQMQRTAEWVEPEPTPKGKPKVNGSDVDSIYKPLSTVYIGASDTTTSPVQQSQKPKVKTKGEPTKEATTIVENGVAPSKPEPIRVDARALKVFKTLFYDPTVTSTPGEISWHDFLYALTSTGQFAAEKLYGSVWQFQMLRGDQSRIQFHEPHPRGKIPFVVARRHGRRLNRNYGWTREMFELK